MGLWDYQQYVIDQKLLSVRQTYMIRDPAGTELGKIEKKLISLGPKYTITDATGAEMGRIEGKVISVRPTYNILDPAGATLATIKKKLFALFGGEYWFENPQGQEIMRAKGNFLSYEYKINDSSGQPLAEVSKKLFSIRDSYAINIVRADANRYLVMSAVICIDACEHPHR
jgi:uncharacterized protein YxjI